MSFRQNRSPRFNNTLNTTVVNQLVTIVNTDDISDVVSQKTVAVTWALSNTVSISNTVAKATTFTRTRANTNDISETIAKTVSLHATPTDTVQISDTAVHAETHGCVDTVQISNTVVRTLSVSQALANTVQISDTVAKVFSGTRPLSNTVQISDTTAKLAALHVAPADTVQISDICARVQTRIRALANTVQISDVVAKQIALHATPANTVQCSATIVKNRTATRVLANTVEVGDGAFQGDGVFSGGKISGAGTTGTTSLPHFTPQFANTTVIGRVGGKTNNAYTFSNFVVGIAGDPTFSRIDAYIMVNQGPVGPQPFVVGQSWDTVVIPGVASASPVPPSLPGAYGWTAAIALAYILVPANATDSSQCTITDARTYVSAVTVNVNKTLGNTAQISATTARAIALHHGLADTVQISDTTARATTVSRALINTDDISDTTNSVFTSGNSHYSTAPADTVQISNTVAKTLAITRSLANAVQCSDIVARAESIAKTRANTANISDTTARIVSLHKTLANTVQISDVAFRGGSQPHPANIVQISDVVAKFKTASKAITEYVDIWGSTIGKLYDFSYPGAGGLYGGYTINAVSFPGIATQLTAASFGLYRFDAGPLTGTLKAELYLATGVPGSEVGTGSPLATSNTVDITTVPMGDRNEQKFIFPTPYTMTAGTRYVIALNSSGLSSSSGLFIEGRDDAYSAGNTSTQFDGIWTPEASPKLAFSIYGPTRSHVNIQGMLAETVQISATVHRNIALHRPLTNTDNISETTHVVQAHPIHNVVNITDECDISAEVTEFLKHYVSSPTQAGINNGRPNGTQITNPKNEAEIEPSETRFAMSQ